MDLASRSGSTRKPGGVSGPMCCGVTPSAVSAAGAAARNSNVHHMVPRTAGGLDVPSNCRALCLACHDGLHGR